MASTRRLAAIMFTDMVGYTASTQTNEASTLQLLHDHEGLVRPLFAAHHGREIKSTGDGFMVEFDSALKAANCAIDIQRRIYDRNAEEAVAPIRIRIGIHLGDVVQSGADILGDAVNIAARIEPLAEPGGVCVSGAVREQIWNKIPDRLEKLPPKALKGLQVPMEIYRVVLPWTGREPPTYSSAPSGLAVLPFANISPDPKDEYFADGLTEELITVLSQLRGFRVIARTSVMPYKSTSKGVSQIGAELRVSSVLEGSVRKAGNRLRVTAQLIDVGSEGHVWANTYDRELDDVFAVQAEIAKHVAEALKIELRAAEEARLEARPTVRSDSYLAYLKGRTLQHNPSRSSLEAAKEQFELAISLDPRNAAAHSGLADVLRVFGWYWSSAPQTEWEETCRGLVARAIELDPNLAEGHASQALVLAGEDKVAEAEKEIRIALSLNPSYSFAHDWYAVLLENQARTDEALVEYALAEGADPLWAYTLLNQSLMLVWLGRLDEALVKIQKLGKTDPTGDAYHAALGIYYLARSDLEGCLKELDRFAELTPEPRWKPVVQALGCALSGDEEKARALLQKEEALPKFGASQWTIVWAYCELGDLDACFRWIERRVAFQQIRLDPRLEPIRKDPRFPALLKRMNLA